MDSLNVDADYIFDAGQLSHYGTSLSYDVVCLFHALIRSGNFFAKFLIVM